MNNLKRLPIYVEIRNYWELELTNRSKKKFSTKPQEVGVGWNFTLNDIDAAPHKVQYVRIRKCYEDEIHTKNETKKSAFEVALAFQAKYTRISKQAAIYSGTSADYMEYMIWRRRVPTGVISCYEDQFTQAYEEQFVVAQPQEFYARLFSQLSSEHDRLGYSEYIGKSIPCKICVRLSIHRDQSKEAYDKWTDVVELYARAATKVLEDCYDTQSLPNNEFTVAHLERPSGIKIAWIRSTMACVRYFRKDCGMFCTRLFRWMRSRENRSTYCMCFIPNQGYKFTYIDRRIYRQDAEHGKGHWVDVLFSRQIHPDLRGSGAFKFHTTDSSSIHDKSVEFTKFVSGAVGERHVLVEFKQKKRPASDTRAPRCISTQKTKRVCVDPENTVLGVSTDSVVSSKDIQPMLLCETHDSAKISLNHTIYVDVHQECTRNRESASAGSSESYGVCAHFCVCKNIVKWHTDTDGAGSCRIRWENREEIEQMICGAFQEAQTLFVAWSRNYGNRMDAFIIPRLIDVVSTYELENSDFMRSPTTCQLGSVTCIQANTVRPRGSLDARCLNSGGVWSTAPTCTASCPVPTVQNSMLHTYIENLGECGTMSIQPFIQENTPTRLNGSVNGTRLTSLKLDAMCISIGSVSFYDSATKNSATRSWWLFDSRPEAPRDSKGDHTEESSIFAIYYSVDNLVAHINRIAQNLDATGYCVTVYGRAVRLIQ